ncbi:MAG: anhydro-N-acetylmuramic acid kinase [Bacteroidales bacterium]|jgi:anhydro-N-acetylmuramic acid kinase|nr:anhydro-N-acetylmuramic acid kinase [Bacteroidales bacterium]
MKNKYSAIGLMSGTSLDGLDIAFCEFENQNNAWTYCIAAAETVEYNDGLREKLQNAVNMSGLELSLLNVEFGRFCGEKVKQFIENHNVNPEIIASHGHTVFHQPENFLTLQIGDGASIAALSGVKTISNFRNSDMALGGQGSPLVPIGDKLLFGKYDFCLNLGGIANISFETVNQHRVSFDICFCNMALNFLSNKLGKEYDSDGKIAQSGKTDENLLKKLNSLDYFKQNYPKSLGFERFEHEIKPLLLNDCVEGRHYSCKYKNSKKPYRTYPKIIENQLHTFTEHIAQQITLTTHKAIHSQTPSVLITGGGAKNKFLLSILKQKNPDINIIVPENLLIDYKEALIFAFLGVLRIREEINCITSVTGAKHNNIGGCVYLNAKNQDSNNL